MWISKDEYNMLKRKAENINVYRQNNMMLRKAEDFACEQLSKAHKELYEIKKELAYYFDYNEEKGVVYIPKFVIEKILCRK